jgi:hypothetical protein
MWWLKVVDLVLALPKIFQLVKSVINSIGDLKDKFKYDGAREEQEKSHDEAKNGARPKYGSN